MTTYSVLQRGGPGGALYKSPPPRRRHDETEEESEIERREFEARYGGPVGGPKQTTKAKAENDKRKERAGSFQPWRDYPDYPRSSRSGRSGETLRSQQQQFGDEPERVESDGGDSSLPREGEEEDYFQDGQYHTDGTLEYFGYDPSNHPATVNSGSGGATQYLHPREVNPGGSYTPADYFYDRQQQKGGSLGPWTRRTSLQEDDENLLGDGHHRSSSALKFIPFRSGGDEDEDLIYESSEYDEELDGSTSPRGERRGKRDHSRNRRKLPHASTMNSKKSGRKSSSNPRLLPDRDTSVPIGDRLYSQRKVFIEKKIQGGSPRKNDGGESDDEQDQASTADSNIHGKEWNKDTNPGPPTKSKERGMFFPWKAPAEVQREKQKREGSLVAGQRLYRSAQALQASLKKRAEDEKNERLKKEKEETTLHPKICDESRALVGNKRPIQERVGDEIREASARYLAKTAEVKDEESKRCSFVPETTRKSTVLAKQFNEKHLGLEGASAEVGDRLFSVYQQHQWRRVKREQLLYEEQVKASSSPTSATRRRSTTEGGGIASPRVLTASEARNTAERLHYWKEENMKKQEKYATAVEFYERKSKTSSGKEEVLSSKKVNVEHLLDRLVPREKKRIGPDLPKDFQHPDLEEEEEGDDLVDSDAAAPDTSTITRCQSEVSSRGESGPSKKLKTGHQRPSSVSPSRGANRRSSSSPRRPNAAPRNKSRFTPLFDSLVHVAGGKHIAKSEKKKGTSSKDTITLSYNATKAFILKYDPKNGSIVSALHRLCAPEAIRASHHAGAGSADNGSALLCPHGTSGFAGNRTGNKKPRSLAEEHFFDPIKNDVFIDHNTFCYALLTYEQEYGLQRWSSPENSNHISAISASARGPQKNRKHNVSWVDEEEEETKLGERLRGEHEDSVEVQRAKFLAWCDNGGLPFTDAEVEVSPVGKVVKSPAKVEYRPCRQTRNNKGHHHPSPVGGPSASSSSRNHHHLDPSSRSHHDYDGSRASSIQSGISSITAASSRERQVRRSSSRGGADGGRGVRGESQRDDRSTGSQRLPDRASSSVSVASKSSHQSSSLAAADYSELLRAVNSTEDPNLYEKV